MEIWKTKKSSFTIIMFGLLGLIPVQYCYFEAIKYGEKGIEIAKKAYYNIYKEEISDKDIVNYLRKNISDYSSDIDERFLNRPIKSKYFKEIVPEILAKDLTNPNEFTNEFVSILKEVILWES